MQKAFLVYAILLLLALEQAALAQDTLSMGQEIAGKYLLQTEDGPLVVYLEEVDGGIEGALLLGYGVLLPLEARLEGNALRGQLSGSDPPTAVEGRLNGDRLELTLIQGSERLEKLALERQTGGEPIAADATPLLRMLALVPDTLGAVSGVPGVGYVDLRAVEAAAAVEGPRNAADFEAMAEDQRTRWLEAVRRIRVGPRELLTHALLAIESMPELLGFEWFDIDQAVSYGVPPHSPTILKAAIDPGRLAESLARRDLDRAERHGVAVWHRQADGAQDLRSRDPGDPFGGYMGAAQRIAVLPGYLANSRYWRLTEAIIGAHGDRRPSLADSPAYRTLAEAVDDGEAGVLLQAVFMDTFTVGLMPDDPARFLGIGPEEVRERLRVEAEEARPDGEASRGALAEPLPLYGLAVLADRQERHQRVGMIALLYEDAATAEAAAEELSRRLENLVLSADNGGLTSVDRPRVHRSETGLAAAVASLRYTEAADGGDESLVRAGFPEWMDAIARRDFTILRVGFGR